MNKRLTKREREIQDLILKGNSNMQIAEELSISINTVKTHVAHILKKESAKNRVELISNQLKKHKL